MIHSRSASDEGAQMFGDPINSYRGIVPCISFEQSLLYLAQSKTWNASSHVVWNCGKNHDSSNSTVPCTTRTLHFRTHIISLHIDPFYLTFYFWHIVLKNPVCISVYTHTPYIYICVCVCVCTKKIRILNGFFLLHSYFFKAFYKISLMIKIL